LFEGHLPFISKTDSLIDVNLGLHTRMFVKAVSSDSSDNEIELQSIASRYGFSPKIISSTYLDGKCFIHMEHVDEVCLADKYGDDAKDIPEWIWEQIRTMIKTLFEEEGIEYIDITPYNFIEKDNRIYIIDFGDSKYTNGQIDWFLQEFIDGENSWNPDYK
jgi:tRNA A-37 threonylcarbamoyl transferase component Bud32